MYRFIRIVKKVHAIILPKDTGVGLFPYAWLIYLLMYIVPVFFHERPLWHYVATISSVLVFLVLYFRAFWVSGSAILWYVAGILCIGVVGTFFNTASSVFFVYAAAFAVNLRRPRMGMLLVLSISCFAALISVLFALSPFFYLPATVITLLIGFLNIYEGEIKKKNRLLKMSQEELRVAAAATERERIARDLHDLIGHTFSVITMKSQLANKLIDRDLALAKVELKDLEQISRKALSEVREAVTGYKQSNVEAEISKAKIVTQSADIKLHCNIETFPTSEKINSVLGFMIKEAMTNLIRHSDANECWIAYTLKNDVHRLKIKDNGLISPSSNVTNTINESNGIIGMRERIESLGGQLIIESNSNFTLIAEIPENEKND
ncbi:sensor histidine kinase [Agaribacter marinus]|uniref:Histidine kinase n=1 Tax=Agaribacter marinus TaxID=1431249 RepID=A0AA37WK67_9ALTE|nr:sensor histidine kinase [Agaribacter marinus]GLR70685.1 histidine kinase [Agaribacter marinus]